MHCYDILPRSTIFLSTRLVGGTSDEFNFLKPEDLKEKIKGRYFDLQRNELLEDEVKKEISKLSLTENNLEEIENFKNIQQRTQIWFEIKKKFLSGLFFFLFIYVNFLIFFLRINVIYFIGF